MHYGSGRLSLVSDLAGGSIMVRSRSFIAIPPGETIKELLEDRGISQKEFAGSRVLCALRYAHAARG